MHLVERDTYYLIEDFFPSGVIAGFTKPYCQGRLPDEMKEILADLKVDARLAYMKQIHSQIVHKIDLPGVYQGDGLFTDKRSLVLIVRTADCLPLLFASESGTVGVIHLGWRPAEKGILSHIPFGLGFFKVAAGVGLRKCCYQVGREFLQSRALKDFCRKKQNKLALDVTGFAKVGLARHGLKPDNFADLNICSFCSDSNFLSWRRDKTEDRTLSFIIKV